MFSSNNQCRQNATGTLLSDVDGAYDEVTVIFSM
jgi:hypothetical protein